MAQKTVGYVELEWVCPNCGSRNKGSVKICAGCGAAQPADVKFQQAAEEKLIEKTEDPLHSGADIHCPFCGVRNHGSEKVCANCGGDLTGAHMRESGQILGSYHDQAVPPFTCPACGEKNPAANLRCARCGAPIPGATSSTPSPSANKKFPLALVIGLCAVGLVLFVAFFSLFIIKHDVAAKVKSRSWERSVEIEQFGPIGKENWKDEIPVEAKNIQCDDKFRRTSNEPAPKATEVCGTPYTVDQGDGTGKVVTDCEYQVYDAYCKYTVDGWAPVRLETLQGEEIPPTWPEPQIGNNQRSGNRSVRYSIYFDTNDSEKRFNTSNSNLFYSAEPGTLWILKINGLGEVVEITAKQ